MLLDVKLSSSKLYVKLTDSLPAFAYHFAKLVDGLD